MEMIDYRTPAMKRKSSQHAARDSRNIDVATYERVSTRHQTLAIQNQHINLDIEIAKHPEWTLVRQYRDQGKSATTVKNRDAFKQMFKDVEAEYNRTGKPPFQLLVVAELCRFSRSLSDSLVYIDKYKAMGVEIYFIRDEIYTFSSDATIKLGIFAGLAASESEKVRERVNAGLTACRQKGVLFGNGNILGYDLVQPDPKDKTKNTYVKNDDAKTIEQVFKWYIEGHGEKKICSMLIEGGYTNTLGKVKWDPTAISRIIQCKTFAGYKSYLLSQTDMDGMHQREKLPESDHIYIKGDWEPIVSLEIWEEANRIRMSKRRPGLDAMNQRGKGKRPTTDCWMKVMTCQCGWGFAKFKWRVKEDGTPRYGYCCRNISAHRRKSFHIANGQSGDGMCDVKAIPEWKLQYQFIKIMKFLWDEPEKDVEYIQSVIENSYTPDEEESLEDTSRLETQITILKHRMAALVDKYLDGMIEEEIYNTKYQDLKEKLADAEKRLLETNTVNAKTQVRMTAEEDRENILDGVRKQLLAVKDMVQGKLDEKALSSLVPTIIDRVTPTESGEFLWYLALGGEGDSKEFDASNYIQINEMQIGYEEAQQYRINCGSFLRKSQWQDVLMKVFVRI